ncbi:E3 ubiquitin-protein ligase Midline-1-like [Ruditapes philippinarum]|uniref:E3 ubiquitin-protein ligase Midline-1-like n=1 Tax=Ruditapes philippinarum TaxID=129788 RepID=UPI00295C165A|nr:E3 ubiquitin-protein ligase Midline-1-like [Ruditapes philippinarum]
MATGGRSFIRASDIIHDFSCSPCSENKNNSEAIYKCVECKTFLCAKCRDGHNQFVKGHKVVDVRAKDIGGSLIHWKGYKCEEHPDKMIEMYCKTHDEVYCPVCILKHRSCTGVDYIPNVAKTVRGVT